MLANPCAHCVGRRFEATWPVGWYRVNLERKCRRCGNIPCNIVCEQSVFRNTLFGFKVIFRKLAKVQAIYFIIIDARRDLDGLIPCEVNPLKIAPIAICMVLGRKIARSRWRRRIDPKLT